MRGWTITPRVATYFSNSPVRWCFTDVVFPAPPLPTNISLNWTWGSPWAAIMMSLPEASLDHLTGRWKDGKRVIPHQDFFCLDSTEGQLDPAISLYIYPGSPCVFRNCKEYTCSNAFFSGGRALLLNRQLFLLRAYLLFMSYKVVRVYITMAWALVVHKMLY